jgi:hypothetical protein
MSRLKNLMWVFCLNVGFGCAWAVSGSINGYPTVSLHDIPQPLQELYKSYKPEMNPFSHCAAAFDGHSDGQKMVLRCSIYIKMSAEGERRAMQHCEEKRSEQKIIAPCRLVVEP